MTKSQLKRYSRLELIKDQCPMTVDILKDPDEEMPLQWTQPYALLWVLIVGSLRE